MIRSDLPDCCGSAVLRDTDSLLNQVTRVEDVLDKPGLRGSKGSPGTPKLGAGSPRDRENDEKKNPCGKNPGNLNKEENIRELCREG